MNHSTTLGGKGSGSMVRVAGGLGLAACVIGLTIFLTSCGGYEGALSFAALPLVLGLPGMVLAVLGAVYQENPDDTHVMGAFFPCMLGAIGGLVEMSAWLHWTVFAK